ncbi:MAG: flagellar biosynthesis protein FlhB [Desulfohalobiaceae bacterium]|nr:flagellar biosynthesis protein FlhB [Desulfohalobiaceae bacterium]
MAEEQQAERTEEPTEKRRREFREKGQVAQSREVNTALLLTGTLILWTFYAPVFWEDLRTLLAFFWRLSSEYTVNSLSVQKVLLFVLQKMAGLLWPLLATGLVLGFLSSYLQIGWLFTVKPLQPDLNKFDPIKGMAKFVSKRSFFEAGKSFGKVFLVAAVAYWTLFTRFEEFLGLAGAELSTVIAFLTEVMFVILARCCVLLIVIAVADYLFSRFEMEQKMKMTKQELKEENKETEGDPQVKQRVRSIQREMARKRMMAEVPESDVIITNPTSYAVAIRYKKGEMEAPLVAAKGVDHLAGRIREIGKEHGVPLVENPPVARALYEVELGETIPEQMYKAVAEILAYVYSLKSGEAS